MSNAPVIVDFHVLTKTLAEAQADGIKGIQQLFERCASLRRNVPNPSAVKVHQDALTVCPLGNFNNILLRDDCPVQGILESNDSSRCTTKKLSGHSRFNGIRLAARMSIYTKYNVGLYIL